MTLEGELFTVSSNIHNHKNRTSLKGPPPLFFPSPFQTSAFLINCAIPNRSFFLVNTFSLTDRESNGGGGGDGRGRKGERQGEADWRACCTAVGAKRGKQKVEKNRAEKT